MASLAENLFALRVDHDRRELSLSGFPDGHVLEHGVFVGLPLGLDEQPRFDHEKRNFWVEVREEIPDIVREDPLPFREIEDPLQASLQADCKIRLDLREEGPGTG
jgi:hypothetical protein